MSDKKLEVTVKGGNTEVAKNKILATAGVLEEFAEIERDSNGRVVKVKVKCSDEEHEAKKTALDDMDEVAECKVSDIVPGTAGFDGTAAGLAVLLTQGYSVGGGNTAPATVYNANGTVTYTVTGSSGLARVDYINNSNPIPPAPLAFSFETKMQLIGAGPFAVDMTFANGKFTAGMGMSDSGPVVQDLMTNVYVIYTPGWVNDGLMHVYTFNMSPTGLVTALIDGTIYATGQLTASPINTTNYVDQVTYLFDAQVMTIDYSRWSRA